MKILFISLVLALSWTASSHAQSGDMEAGQAKSAPCAACHGNDGNSPLELYPKIAGQVPGYIAQQLAKFKSGERDDPVMASMVVNLTEQDMADLDAYYSNQEMSAGSIGPDQVEDALAGRQIFRGGLEKYQVPACMGCHGPSGSGIPPAYPRLAGQYPKYLEDQMLAFKSGARHTPVMQPIAFPLSETQIRQLALYISALE
ncbi:MAG: c-type cytochrome [Gammaproteobacteria bacterium]|nr:c-type cytochrome [Gammaproteobacteria bacterium]